MRFYIGVTDNSWFRFLAERNADEVNFWQPGGKTGFQAVAPGAPFLFKLHKPVHKIVGGGFFVRQSRLPVSIAWEAFGEKNGLASRDTFLTTIQAYRRDREPDPTIGCIVLTDPFYLPQDQWIDAPRDWANSIVQGKTYDSDAGEGAYVWNAVMERLQAYRQPTGQRHWVAEIPGGYGAAYLSRARIGQGAFRVLVTEAYNRRCALTGEKTLPVLQASHIKPFAKQGPHRVSNGLLLRSDLHLLFDTGLITVTPDYHVEVSGKIREQWENGRIYYALHGAPLKQLPENELERPSREFIEWHNSNVYAG